MKMKEQKVLDDLVAHNVAKVEIKFEGQMIQHDDAWWQFEPEKDGWLIKVEDTAGKVLVLDDDDHLDDLDFAGDFYNEETIGGLCREEVEDYLSWYWTADNWSADVRAQQDGETAKGSILINVEARTISITGTKQTMALVTKPFENTRKVEDKETAAA